MTSNEGQPAGTDTQDNYESTVLDFLDKEMATVQEAHKKNQQSDELDALVTDLLKQVITEADQTQAVDKPWFDEDELFSGLPGDSQITSTATGTDKSSTADQPADPVHSPFPASTAKPTEKVETTVAKPVPKSEILKTPQASPSVVFGASVAPQRRIPVMAAAVAGLVMIIAASFYFFSGSSSKTPNSEGSHATVAQAAKAETPASAATSPVKPTASPAPRKSAATTTGKPGPAAIAQKQAAGKTAAAPVSQTPQPAATQQAGKPATAKAQAEPPVAVPAKGPAEERTVVAQSAPVTPLSAPIAATIERPVTPPVTEHAAPVTPSAQERRPTPPPQASNAASETTAPASQPATSAAPPVNNLVAAVPIMQTSPVYPEVALRTRASGSIVLELQIDDQGKVIKATPVSGPAIFHNAAVSAAMKWRYKPASIGGVNVSSQSRVTMAFNLKK
jgi:periplasmic protein TonB